MKKIFVFLLLAATLAFVFGCVSQSSPSGRTDGEAEPAMLGLNEAMRDFSLYLSSRIQKDSPSAVLNVVAPLRGIADYITDTLTEEILNTAGARMVSRQNLETVKREQNIQADGSVDDDTAVRIGHIAGWRTVITGTVTPLETGYRMSLRAVDVESAELLGAKGYLIKSDAVLAGIVNPSQTVQELSRREELLRPFKEQRNDFELEVHPTGGKDVFYDGEELRISLRAGIDCYFVVYQVDVNNQMQIIIPNPYDTDNTLKAGIERIVPEYSHFDLHAPFGEERILVYASEKPIVIPPEQYEPRELTQEYIANPATPWQAGKTSVDGSKALSIRSRGAAGQFTYAILPGR
jgi:TolB-like protein